MKTLRQKRSEDAGNSPRLIAQTMTSEMLRVICDARRLTRLYNEMDTQNEVRKRTLLEQLLGSVGEDVEIDTPFRCDFGKNTHIGDHVIVGMNCTFVDNARIDIER
ncbi:MAG: hypothetical protein IJR99_14035 [Kiritimatiellae bacterium]|nr:hypothetical protein [Kiritimatiellia bacterium]